MVKTLFIMLTDTIKVQEILKCIKMYIFKLDINDRVSRCSVTPGQNWRQLPIPSSYTQEEALYIGCWFVKNLIFHDNLHFSMTKPIEGWGKSITGVRITLDSG